MTQAQIKEIIDKYDPNGLLESSPPEQLAVNKKLVAKGEMSSFAFKSYVQRATYWRRRQIRKNQLGEVDGKNLNPREILPDSVLRHFKRMNPSKLPEPYSSRLKELQDVFESEKLVMSVIADTIRDYVFQTRPLTVEDVKQKAEVQPINRKSQKASASSTKGKVRFEYNPDDPRSREIQLQAFAKQNFDLNISPYARQRRLLTT